MLTPLDAELLNRLNRLLPQQLDQLLLRLEIPNHVMPRNTATHGDRVTALVEWARSSGGCDLEQVAKKLDTLESSFEDAVTPQAGSVKANGDVTNSVIITGNDKIVNLLVRGIDRLPTDYSTPIGNFLKAYLGTPQEPVPFGGRQHDLDYLDHWLAETQNTPPYLLLAAPAGRGKSALLVHWCARLAKRRDVAVVFVPVSIRYGTNRSEVFFAAAAARLAVLHGEDVPTTSNSVPVWKSLMADYLRRPSPDGRQLLLVLDGLDEAANLEVDWGLFSTSPKKGVRVIVSARFMAGDTNTRGWLTRLGWTSPQLARGKEVEPLDESGIKDVLSKMGCPLDVVGSRVDIVRQLYRLSEGDPLLVRLYVDEIWKRGEAASHLQPEDLEHIPPGLKGYFERWWQDQRSLWGKEAPLKELGVRTLLNLFACAFGPLMRRDLFRLLPDNCDLDEWTLDGSLEPLARFVVGDGEVQGYVFNHSRLGYHFRDKLQKSKRREGSERFVEWGNITLKELKTRELEPRDTPVYLVQYFGVHLEEQGASPQDFLKLICDEWRKASLAVEGSYSGFLGDVQRAWNKFGQVGETEVAQGLRISHLSQEILCALCVSSISTLSSRIPGELIALLVNHKLLTVMQGIAYARQKNESSDQTNALVQMSLLNSVSKHETYLVTTAALQAAQMTWPRIMIR